MEANNRYNTNSIAPCFKMDMQENKKKKKRALYFFSQVQVGGR